jgi:hypothetical protein
MRTARGTDFGGMPSISTGQDGLAMRNILGELRTEHANMARLLNILDKQIEIFEGAGQPDYVIMQDIIPEAETADS